MTKQSPKVSMIVTCYNLEHCIGRCLDSLLAQTYENLEILVIDDGSKDHSFDVITQYANKDSRIIPIRQKNAGVSAARNHCLDQFTGDYLMFIDGDDYVAADYVENFVTHANGYDIVIGGLRFIYPDGTQQVIDQFPFACDKEPYLEKYYSQTVALRTIFGPVNKLFLAKLIRDYRLRFDETLEIREDGIFVLSFLSHCHTLCGIDHAGYYYVQNQLGISLVSKFHPTEQAINIRFFQMLTQMKEDLTAEDIRLIYPIFLNMEIASVRKLYCSQSYSFRTGIAYIYSILRNPVFRTARAQYRQVAGKKALKYYRPGLLVHAINYLAARKQKSKK